MTPVTWARVKRLFTTARELPLAQRSAYVDGQDERETVKREARRLLALDNESGIATPDRHGLAANAAERYTFFPGEVLAGRYRIIRFLARGGAGEVYEAEDRERGVTVAIKTLHPELADPAGVNWLRREVQAARQVDHPNVCKVFDFVETPRAVFFTMELLPGETLAAVLQRDGAFPERRALPLIRQIVAGLAAAHGAGLVHRDLKPGNIMVCPRPQGPPRVVLMDFGLARHAIAEQNTTRLTRTSLAAFGTPAYMSPEQIEGRPVTCAADVYALGVVLFEMLTGELPFDDVSPLSMAVRKTKEAPPDPATLAPGLRPVWVRTIRRCLDARPERRFQDVRELLQNLETRSATTVRWRHARRRWRQTYWRFAVAAALLMIASSALWTWGPWPRGAAAMRHWQHGVTALHLGEPLIAAQWLERAVASPRPPARAYGDLALAWHELKFGDRARRALAAAPWFAPAADRAILRAAAARLEGGDVKVLLAGMSEADRAWFGGNPADGWRKVLAADPGHLAARFHLAALTDPASAAREYEAIGLTARGLGNAELAQAIERRQGLEALRAGDAEAARRLLGKGELPYSAGAAPCERFMVLWAGVPDDFVDPPEPVPMVSAGFQKMSIVQGFDRMLQFDEKGENRILIASLPLPGVRLCSGTLESRVSRRQVAGGSNDEIQMGFAPFDMTSPRLRSFLWADAPTAMWRNLSIPISAPLLAAAQAAHASDPQATLDIFVGDDTSVDYFKLTLVY